MLPFWILYNNWSFLIVLLSSNLSQPVSLYRYSVLVKIGSPVIILAASNCSLSNLLVECCYIWMESSHWDNWKHLFCRKVSFLTAPRCQFRGVGQGRKQTFLYMISSSMGSMQSTKSLSLELFSERTSSI